MTKVIVEGKSLYGFMVLEWAFIMAGEHGSRWPEQEVKRSHPQCKHETMNWKWSEATIHCQSPHPATHFL